MVYLSVITTKTGDDGTTALGNGTRVPKDDPRVEAYGAVDELNSVLGLVLSSVHDLPEPSLLDSIRHDLFDAGADLCVPDGTRGESSRARVHIDDPHIRRLEAALHRLNADLPVLKSFVLPGGTPAAAWLHVARTVCRRAERRVVTLARETTINPKVVVYLNRLSDLLFVLARVSNRAGAGECLWQPNQAGNRDSGPTGSGSPARESPTG
jgi:cob(I)alamin adenosyltransferase